VRGAPLLLTLISVALAAFCGWGWYRAADRATAEAAALTAARDDSREQQRAATSRAADLADHLSRARGDRDRLAAELEASLDRERTLSGALDDANAALEVERAGRDRLDLPVLPEGVRRCLQALHERLREDGVTGLRFLRARAIGDHELLDVELLDHDPASLASTLYVAERMLATLDRADGSLELRFFGGRSRGGGVENTFPEAGYAIVLSSVDGPSWEGQLPYLVRAEGEYPLEVGEVPPQHPAEVFAWRGRLGQLIELASGDVALRLKDVRSIHDGVFGEFALAGYRNNNLASYAEGDELRVVVDDTSGLVFLELRRGILRDERGETRIGDKGYRMLLRDVTPEQARKVMMGMIHAND